MSATETQKLEAVRLAVCEILAGCTNPNNKPSDVANNAFEKHGVPWSATMWGEIVKKPHAQWCRKVAQS